MEKKETEFYAQLGKLSTNFAMAESYLGDILSFHISNEKDDLITNTIIEDMSLYKRLVYLNKIIKIKSDYEKEVANITDKLEKVRKIRNLFIHGLWTELFEHEGKMRNTVVTKKIKFSEYDSKTRKPKKSGGLREWRRNNIQTFTLEEIKDITIEVASIVCLQIDLLEEIEEKGFE